MRRLLLLLAVLFGAALFGAGPASAHATVVASDPVDGARLSSVPARVTISFDEDVGLGSAGYLHVTDQSGNRVESGAAFHPGGHGTEIAADLPSGLRAGTYTESYRVVSADSHPVAGVVRFVVGSGPLVTTGGGAPSSTVNHAVSVALDASRWLSYAGFAVLGGAWLLLTVWTGGRDARRARRLVWAGWAAALAGAVLELLLQGAYAAGRGFGSVGNWALIDATLHSNYGEYHSARLVLLGIVGVLFSLVLQPGRVRARYEYLFWPAAVGIAFTFAATGHARTTNPAWISLVLDTAHLCAMGIWVGGLVMLTGAVLPRRVAAELDEVLPVFSRAAFVAISVLAVTGTYAAWRGVGSLRALFSTEYGLLVVGKIVLFFGILALGNVSRRVVQRRVGRPLVAYAMTDELLEDPIPELDTERVRRAVLVEVAIAVLVLALTAVLVGQPRGAEALAAQARAPVTASAPVGAGRDVRVTVNPGRHGLVDVAIMLQGGSHPKSVVATATQPAQQIGPIPLKLVADGAHGYQAAGVNLPVAGTWVIDLVITRSQFDAVSTQATVHLT